MVVQVETENKSLYDTDYNLWVLETGKKLENKDLDSLDWENLIEEVLDLSRRDKKKLKSLLRHLWEHLLKIKYWQSEIERNKGHWQGEIINFQKQIKDELQDSPSLKRYLSEIYEECYQDGREIASKRSQLPLNTFPEKPIAPLEQILDENWLP
jgi:predicted transcriptional regulator